MTAIGGSVESVTVSGREFAAAADSDSNLKLGGFENAVEANGNETARLLKTRIPNALSNITLEISEDNGDLEFLQAEQAKKGFFDFAVTFVSGATYSGLSQIVGPVERSSATATAPLNFSGPGKLVKQ